MLVDLLNRGRRKITKIAEDKKNHKEKIIRLRSSMCDRKALAEEAWAAVSTVEANVTSLEKHLQLL